jgi:hypothetical protein
MPNYKGPTLAWGGRTSPTAEKRNPCVRALRRWKFRADRVQFLEKWFIRFCTEFEQTDIESGAVEQNDDGGEASIVSNKRRSKWVSNRRDVLVIGIRGCSSITQNLNADRVSEKTS